VSENVKALNDKPVKKRRKRVGRNFGFVFLFIVICLIVSISSCAVTYNLLNIEWLGISRTTVEEPLDDNELMVLNEELREENGILRAQVEQLEAQLDRERALRGNLPVGTGVTNVPVSQQPPAETTTPPTGGTGAGTSAGTGASAGTGTTGGTATTPPTDGEGTGTGTTTTPPAGGSETIVIPQTN